MKNENSWANKKIEEWQRSKLPKRKLRKLVESNRNQQIIYHKGYKIVNKKILRKKLIYFLCKPYIVKKRFLFFWISIRQSTMDFTYAISFSTPEKAINYIDKRCLGYKPRVKYKPTRLDNGKLF